MARAVNSQAGRLSTRRGRGRVGDSEFGVRIVIDPDGYRPNVGIVLMHPDGRVFWARRVRRDGWQFPQGGMNTDETPLERSEEHTSELQSLMRISYAVFCLKKKNNKQRHQTTK